MAEVDTYDSDARVSPLIPMTIRELITTALTGAAVGVFTAIVYLLMNHFVFGAVLCRPQSPGTCGDAPMYAMIVAMVIGSIAGIGALSRLRIYRPLLIVAAAVISLWGFQTIATQLTWYWLILALAVLLGLAYALFTWIARIRSFIMALVITVVMIIIVRLVLNA